MASELTNVRDRFYANKCPRSQMYSSFRLSEEKREGRASRDSRYMCNAIATHTLRLRALLRRSLGVCWLP
jgi:hypothetical protein